MDRAVDYPTLNMGYSFACYFHSTHVGETTQLLGRDVTMEVNPSRCRTYVRGVEARVSSEIEKGAGVGLADRLDPHDAVVLPDYAFKPGELRITSHMQDFQDCVRTRGVPRCGVDRAFEEAATILMSVEAFKKGRKVHWDTVKEEFV